MKRRHFGWLLAIPVFMGVGLTSCSSEEPISKVQDISTEKVEVTLIANLGNTTRASLTFDGEKALKFKWEKDDVIKAVNADNGAYLGTLNVSEVKDDPHFCVFKGTLNLPTSGTANLKFYYLGEKGNMAFDDDGNIVDHLVDYSHQNGTAEELDDYDILQANKEYKGSDNGNLGMLDFERFFSQGQFILKYNNDVLDLSGRDVQISVNTGKFYNKASLNFQSGEFALEEGTITVSGVSSNFYLNLIPTEAVNMMFTVTMPEGTFVGYKGKEILSDTYYSDNREPIVVEMENSSLICYEIKFEDENYNPLDIPAMGTPSTDPTQNVTPLPEAPEKEDYVFSGWVDKDEPDGEPKKDAWELTSEKPQVTLIPVYTEKEYPWTVTWMNGYNDTHIKKKTYFGKNGSVDISGEYPAEPTREGYTFDGWDKYIDKLSKNETDVVITAQWTKDDINYVVNYEDGNNNVIGTKPVVSKEDKEIVNVNEGAPVDKVTVPAYHEFVGWAKKGDTTKKVLTEVELSNPGNTSITLVPVFNKKSTVSTPGYGHGEFN